MLIGLNKNDFLYAFEQGKASGPTTKEELGRATWTFLHTLAAQVLSTLSISVVEQGFPFQHFLGKAAPLLSIT